MHHNALFPALFRQRHNAVKTYVPTTFYPTTIKSKKCPNNFQSFPVHLNVTNLSLAILSPQLKVPLQIQQNPDFIEGMRGQIGQVTKNVILPP